jgi:chromosome segregation ATPase
MKTMPDYESLYYSAKNHYDDALDYRYTLQNEISDLENSKRSYENDLDNKQDQLTALKNKKSLIKDALKNAKQIESDEFSDMKSSIKTAGSAYKTFVVTDSTAADLESIYSSDVTTSKSNLDTVITNFEKYNKDYDDKIDDKKREIKQCKENLSNVKSKLRSKYSDQASNNRSIDYYYAEMQHYKKKWQED